jgi:hypothetical protein
MPTWIASPSAKWIDSGSVRSILLVREGDMAGTSKG